MVIPTASWADFGYRKLGPLPVSGGGLSPAQVAGRLTQLGDYQVLTDSWARRHARRKGARFAESIRLVSIIGRDTPLDNDCLSFLEEHARSRWVEFESGQPIQLRAQPEILVNGVQSAELGEDRWRGLYRLSQALYFVGPERLRPMFREQVAPCFFRLYPRGKVVVLRYDTAVDEAAAILRTFYALALAPLPELAGKEFRGVQTLRRWHMASLTGLMPALLDLFDFLFYPFVGGVCAGMPGLVFLFMLDPAEEHRPAPFPRNWLGFPSCSPSFGREEVDPLEMIRDPRGPVHRRAGHHRLCHAQGFSADERLDLLRWYIRRINRVLYELTDVCNFTAGHDPQAVVDPIFGFEHLLTVDRLLRKTLLAMSLDEAPSANLTVFEIADLYDSLSERFGNHSDKTTLFKRLFNTQAGPALVAPRFAGLPAPFGDYLAGVTAEVYRKVEETVLASVWRKSKVTSAGVLVRDRNLSREDPMPLPQFVGEVMRAYRNAHHGYFSSDPTSQNRPSRFLFMVDGNLPVEMSALPVLWWLAYLSDPCFVGWKHLELDAYD